MNSNTLRVKEVALRWGITPRAVTTLCKEGKIKNARKEKGIWMIPADAERPVDHRFKSDSANRQAPVCRLPLPIGISDYRLASSEYYYVDKTLMIRDFLDERPMVSLFTRPRRFGKTLNMDMLRTFFEKTDEDTSVYFKDKKIWSCGKKYQKYQGKYPVIFLTFKDVKRENWEETYEHLVQLISEEFQRHSELLESQACSNYEKDLFQKITARNASSTDYISSLKILSEMLRKHYQEAVVMIIDEYDTPIQQGYLQGFYEPIISFLRNLFSGGLKDNKNLAYGFLTGILRVAKESIFSGLNNLVVNSVLDTKYSNYFGFTKEEIEIMADYYDSSEKIEEICDWYGGYFFGNTEIFNPWSVINYLGNHCEPRTYWVSTSSNDIIGEILAEADNHTYEQLTGLLQGKKLLTYIDTSVIYPQIKSNPSSIYSFLLVSGYLKTTGPGKPFGTGNMCEVALPNREILFVYQSEILDKLSYIIPRGSSIGIQEAVYSGNVSVFKERLNTLLKTSVSYYDTAGENFYHGLMLGLLAMTDNRYKIFSNGESGDGRYDICLIPQQQKLPGVIIELKASRKCSANTLKELAADALIQIENRHYDTQLLQSGISNILKYGVSFCGKNVEIIMAEN